MLKVLVASALLVAVAGGINAASASEIKKVDDFTYSGTVGLAP